MKDICKLRPQVGKSCILPSESAAPRTGHKHKQHPQATSEGQYNEHSPEVKGKEYKTGLTDAPNEAIALPFNPNRSLEKASCHFLMTAIRKTAFYMLDS